ncbi:DUF3015 family protein [Oceanospirillum maris]|uniref:DUF3015 family protein n=1 Tax=Oceanospirillum maris TaxID=64977 RepID=UPI0004232B07|nr:DUF3015 family protein [Oceanospirillum maris]
MKKLIAGAILLTSSSMAFAAGNHGPAGCGLGSSVLFPDASKWYEHVMAATTNGTSGNQTFGMTSGTLGCQDANGPLAGGLAFIDNNMDQLAMDAAKGEGESLAALAEVMGIESQDTVAFNHAVQSNFDSIFNADATSGSAYEAMKAVIAKDASLQKYLG